MAAFITDFSEKLIIFNKMIDFQKNSGVKFVRTTGAQGQPILLVSGKRISPDLHDLEAYVLNHDGQAEINLGCTNSKTLLLQLCFYSRNSAAALANIDKEIWILHTGVVHHKHARPYSNEKITVAGRSFNKIACITDPEFFKKIFLYHLSRESAQEAPWEKNISPELTHMQRPAIDAGPLRGGSRAAVVFEARHAPIVISLLAKMKKFGWKPSKPIGECKPDLVIERGSRKVLFEVKPNCDVHSLICAVGQCKVYDLDYQTDRQIIVGISTDSEKAGVPAWIQEAIRKLGIELILASGNEESGFKFRFRRGDELGSALR